MKTYFGIFLVLWNIVVLSFYGLDKRRAVKGQWRISEKTLLLMSLCLGGFGALIGAHIFHHKTHKGYFQLCWYLGLFLDILLIYLVWRI
ncbi:DUF1294 domain-containing protein [Streptococcus caballi]|uniref:DUF1294 domain-containing protein n=1 Tax=Streptococcus caballi TaxID=439220 RepID=UPI00039FDEA5|nr:DUF1294 domain-containing protein [Streptococcus caballi]